MENLTVFIKIIYNFPSDYKELNNSCSNSNTIQAKCRV